MLRGEALVSVMCPICSRRISGTGENDLSIKLQEHLNSAHDFTELCSLRQTSDSEEKQCKPSSSGALADLNYADERAIEGHASPSSRTPGEDVMESVRCPICGVTIYGHAPDDLSYNLSAHMERKHDIRREVLGRA